MSETQISAYISEDTKVQFDAFVKKRGVKKAFMVEEALIHHMQALRELPQDLFIPTKIVVSKKQLNLLSKRLNNNETPTNELIELMNG